MSKRKIGVTVVLAILFAVGAFAVGRKSFRALSMVRVMTQDSVRKRKEAHALVYPDARAIVPNSIQQDSLHSDPPVASITGRVVDAEGKPVVGAKVTALKSDHLSGYLPADETNEKGEFEIPISNSRPGMYKLRASKKSEDYPDTISTIYRNAAGTEPEVIVNERQATRDVTIRLGQKVGMIFGKIVDAETHKPISNAFMTFRRLDNPNTYLQTGANEEGANGAGKFKLLAPLTPFTIEVEAPGYETWTYSNDKIGKHTSPIQVAREQKKELTIALQPIK